VHRVIMVRQALCDVPPDIYQEAGAQFREIAEGLEGIAAESPFWASLRVSRLILEVRGWSFVYTLDDETLRVTEAHKP
jgi:hypothetical protein